ncbi:MAG: hypothetical protein AAF581_11250 [Planctomycetota bacterium]
MAIIPDRNREVDYIPECDKDESIPVKTVFKIRPMSKRAEQQFTDDSVNQSTVVDEVLRDSLVGWENLQNQSGDNVGFGDIDISDLPLGLRGELFAAVTDISQVQASDAKN